MKFECRFVEFGEHPRISGFVNAHGTEQHAYVRRPELFDWAFGRGDRWDGPFYSFVVAEAGGDVVGVLGGVLFDFNALGKPMRAMWLTNLLVHPEFVGGKLVAPRLLRMLQRPVYRVYVAPSLDEQTLPYFTPPAWRTQRAVPRHFAVLPDATGRMVRLLEMIRPYWRSSRARKLARRLEWRGLPGPRPISRTSVPADWNECGWRHWANRSFGAARDESFLVWRYERHPIFSYRAIAVRDRYGTGLAVWRLDLVRGLSGEVLDRVGRLVEFLPISVANAEDILKVFWIDLANAGALGADYYGYHEQIGALLSKVGFNRTDFDPDAAALPSCFQCLAGSDGPPLPSAVSSPERAHIRWADAPSEWYWTVSDADYDCPAALRRDPS